MKVHQGLAGFNMQCRFTTWLFQIAKYRVLDELRARERRVQTPIELDRVPPAAIAAAPEVGFEQMDAVFRAIGELNLDMRAALLLRDVVGLSYNEIAEALEISLATTKWRIFKARELTAARLVAEGVLTPPSTTTSLASSYGSLSETAREAVGEPRRQAGRADVGLRLLDRVLAAHEARRPASVSSSSQAARGSRSRGWPTEPGLRSCLPLELQLLVRLRLAALEAGLAERERELHVAVPDEREVGRLRAQRRVGDVRGQHVLPDRVADRAVEERDALALALRRELRERLALVGREDAARPARRDAGIRGELVDVRARPRRRDRGCRRGRSRRARCTSARHSLGRRRSRRCRPGTRPRRCPPAPASASTASSACRLLWTSDMTATRKSRRPTRRRGRRRRRTPAAA